jgi:ribulose 1,5-bisphosphate synthetase/thiazole synthase
MKRNNGRQKPNRASEKTVFPRKSFRPGAGIDRPKKVGGRFLTEPSRKVPIVREVDVLVVGGGMAGSCAAIAAGRMGSKTVLVEYFGCLGGNATTGLVNTFCGFYTKENLVPVVKGVGGEIIQTMIDRRAAQEKRWGLSFDPENLKLVLDEKMVEAKVEALYYTQMVDPILEKNIVKGVVVTNKGGRQAILARRVLDCTGDGDVCASANVPFELGDGKGGFQACDMAFHLINVGEKFDHENYKKVVFDEALEAIRTGQYKMTRAQAIINHIMVPGAYWVNMAGIPWVVNGIDPSHLTQATIDGRKVVRELQRFFRNKILGLDHADVAQTAAKIGLRETRRVMGGHLLTGEEILQGKKFDDGIGANAWPLETVSAQERKFIFLEGDDFHTIPYRSLVPQKVENLLMAGRFISCTHEAQASIRVTGPASVMGQAIGTAAALSIKERVIPRKLNVKLLQRELEAAGVFLG